MNIPLPNDLNEEITNLIDEYNVLMVEYNNLRNFYLSSDSNLDNFNIYSNKKINIDNGLLDNSIVSDVDECKAMVENLEGNAALFNIENNECSVIDFFPLKIDTDEGYNSIVINQDYILSMLENIVEKLDAKNTIISDKLDNIDDTELLSQRESQSQMLNQAINELNEFKDKEKSFLNTKSLNDLNNIEKISELTTNSYSYWFYFFIIIILIFILIMTNVSSSTSTNAMYYIWLIIFIVILSAYFYNYFIIIILIFILIMTNVSSSTSTNTTYYIWLIIVIVILFAYFYNKYRL